MTAQTLGRTLAVLVWVVSIEAVAQTPDSPRRLTLNECIALALSHNHDVLAADDEVDATEAARASTRGTFLPRLRTEANVIRWNEPLQTSFSPPGAPPSPPFTTRESTTSAVTVSIVQPLTSIWTIYETYRTRDLGVDVARIRREVTQRDAAFQVGETFYRLLQAIRLAEVAATSVEQLEAQTRRAQSFHRQGLVGQNDVLRAELGLSAARQRLIHARGQVTVVRGRLAVLVGLPPDTVIEPTGAPTSPPTHEAALTVEEAERRAMSRVEIRELDARVGQSRAGVRAAWSRMVPQVNVIASYQRNDGSAFVAPNAYYIGAFLTWDVWDWGSTYYGTTEARARLSQAEHAHAKLRDVLRLEARGAFVGYGTAHDALTVAERAIAQAEENYRIESRRYEANASTSFDVLDAEALLTQVRAQYQTALYDYLVAQGALARAVGIDPRGGGGGAR